MPTSDALPIVKWSFCRGQMQPTESLTHAKRTTAMLTTRDGMKSSLIELIESNRYKRTRCLVEVSALEVLEYQTSKKGRSTWHERLKTGLAWLNILTQRRLT